MKELETGRTLTLKRLEDYKYSESVEHSRGGVKRRGKVSGGDKRVCRSEDEGAQMLRLEVCASEEETGG